MAPLVWLVTGSTSGIGLALAKHITSRGDKIIASGRKVEERLGELKSDSFALLELDITAGGEVIAEKIREAWGFSGAEDGFGFCPVVLGPGGLAFCDYVV